MSQANKKTKAVISETRYLVEEHRKGNCSCDLTDGGNGFCIVGQFDEGVITTQEFLNEIFPEEVPQEL